MEKHRCKLCYRRFASGRALAGHMRSHVAHRPLPYALEDEGKTSAAYALRENPRKSFRLADPDSSSSAVHDRESDAESSLQRRPRGRRLRSADFPAADERLSSVSVASSDEDVARWLMLLSRDAWSKSVVEERLSNGWDEVEGEEHEDEEEEDDDNNIGSRSQRRRSRVQRGTCRKVFRSYQAFGGHRAIHKRVGVECIPTATGMRIHSEDISSATVAHHDAKLWECPYCYRVFGSGQALGGHKRSHLSSSSATATTSPALPLPHSPFPFAAGANSNCGIDLNLSAPLEEEAELSAVSVATEFACK